MKELQKYLADDDLFDQLKIWMKTPPAVRGNTMPQHLADKLDRLQQADVWLRIHGSMRRVWPMMLAQYQKKGLSYSESTARREVRQAMDLYQSYDKGTGRYYTMWMLEGLIERAESAHRNHKDKEYALLAMAVDRYIERVERYVLLDEEMITQPIPVQAVVDPTLLGVTPDPDILEKIKKWQERRERDKLMGTASDAEFTEEPEPDDT